MVPPRARCATTVNDSAPTAKNQERRCPRRMPRAVMIMPMPAAAVNAAADWATPRGKHAEHEVESMTQWRRRGNGDVDHAVEEQQAARPTTNRPLATLRAKSFDVDREGVVVRPRTNGARP